LKKWALLAVLFIGILLFWGEGGIPVFGDPSAPANLYVSNRYLEDALEDTATVNVVTAILADYRGYDTLGETTVIFTAGIAVLLLLRREGRL
jgi:multicomponent Na+:H+ antiporter subunit B